MKKCDLLLAGAMLFGFGATAQAQEQLFFFGFEDGVASFTDSANALDSITQLQYYITDVAANGAGYKPEEWTLGPVYDTTMLVLNGISPLASRGDTYDIVVDPDGQHKGEFEAMGAQGGDRYFKYMASGELGGSVCNDYEANLFVRALPIDDYTSYRLSMYVKASTAEGQMNVDLLRGFYNSEKAFSMSGEQNSGEFKLVKENFTTDRWERVTMMSYYQNDSVTNRYMYQAGYWWCDEWKKTIDGTEYCMIVQPDQYYVRLAFMGPGVTYYVDDMALTKSWIGGAEYYQNIMRVDFGYDTNLAELCNATPLKAIKLPAEYFKISGTDNLTGEYFDELVVSAAEYHNDGYLYLWIDEEDSFDYYEDVKVSFTNPTDEKLQLKYDGDLYPMGHDTVWAKAGKIVPDFANEPAFFNPSVSALSMEQMPPIFQYSEPEDGSFGLESDKNSFNAVFNKKVFAKLNQYDPSDTTSVVAIMEGNGLREMWIPTAYDEETNTITFSRQAGNTTPLVGDYEFTIVQARASARSPQAEHKTITLSFGPADVAPKKFADLKFDAFSKGTNTIEGLSVNQSCMMEVTEFQGAYTKALKFGLYGANLQNGAPVLTYSFNVSEAGQWLVKYGTSGCLKNSWNDGCKMIVTVIDEAGDTLDIYEEGGTDKKPEEGGVVSAIDEQVRTVNFPVAGNYQLVFTLPNEQSWGGGHKGGRVLYYVEVSNAYSRAYAYIEKYENALNAAKDLAASAAETLKYTGAYLNALNENIVANTGFSSTSPTEYNNTVSSINDAIAVMNGRISTIDTYYAAYQAALDMEALYKDSIGYQDLAAFAALKAIVAKYAELDVTVKDNDEMKAITDEVNATTKAMTDRCALIDTFNSLIAKAEELFEELANFANIAEYKELQAVYNAKKDLAKYAVSDDELKGVNDALSAAISKLENKVAAANALTAQVKGLAEMAEALEVNFGAMAEDLNAQLALELEDNQALANVYKLGIKGALETMMAGEGIDEAGMDMTNFIQNSILYAGIKGYSTPDYMGQPHNGGNAVKFSDKFKSEPEKILPGWTIETQKGNVYMMNLNLGDVSDSQLALDWGAEVSFAQELTNLPAGKYSFSIAPSCDAADQLTGEIVFIQETEQGEVVDTLNMSSAINADRMISFDYNGGNLKLFVHIVDANTWSRYNEIGSLTLIEPLKGYNYTAAAAASAEAMNQAYTGVGSVVTPSKVEFYNLNGMQVSEPNKGVNIRISTGANGQRVAEKVLVK